MSYIEAIVSIILCVIFFSSVTPTAFSLLSTDAIARKNLEDAAAIEFVDKSFRKACAVQPVNIDKWKRDVCAVTNVDSLELQELYSGTELRAIKAICEISGEQVTIVAECAK